MADAKLSALTPLTGADSASGDLFYVDDISVTTSKSITRAELAIGMNATQAEQETGTATNKLVSPAVQNFHNSACKAWGFIQVSGLTVNASYPAAGTGMTKSATGVYVITHGKTFSSSNYSIAVSCEDATACIAQVLTRDATTFTAGFFDATGAAVDPDHVYYQCFGDLS